MFDAVVEGAKKGLCCFSYAIRVGQRALMTATESAPARLSRALDEVIPPIATSGKSPIACRTARNPSRPSTGAVSLFVAVAKIGPMAR